MFLAMEVKPIVLLFISTQTTVAQQLGLAPVILYVRVCLNPK